MDTEISYVVASGVQQALAEFEAPERLGFGVVPAPVMYSATFNGEVWSRGTLMPFGEISILPNARSLQFAESIFEGMKAYRRPPRAPHLFRPQLHYARFVESARRLGMPVVPREYFFEGIAAVADVCADIIPSGSGSFLYLRPFLFSTEPGYTVFNSKQFRFMVCASPSESYSQGAIRVRIERVDVRAARGGIGYAKTAGNYSAAMKATSAAVQSGFTMALWLDPLERSNIEELSGMNVFALVDGELHTPELSDSILRGVTRESVIALSRNRGLVVHERKMPIAELLEAIKTDRCREMFATGTAAIVAVISHLGDADGEIYPLPDATLSLSLREELLSIQELTSEDSFGWICEIGAGANDLQPFGKTL